MVGWYGEANFQQESSRYHSRCLILIVKVAAAASIAIQVQEAGFGGAKGGGSSGGGCVEISELVSGLSGGETADESAGWVFWVNMSGATPGGCEDSCETASPS